VIDGKQAVRSAAGFEGVKGELGMLGGSIVEERETEVLI
jgi:hypothetical protein